MRETSLWFFDNNDSANANVGAGILTDGRPAEFWALEDLARGDAGVRVRTATGRTCSVVLMRRGSGDDGTGERGNEEEEEEEEGEETEFQMIDGKERERILEWVRRHRGAFGIAKIRGGEKDDGGAQASSRDAAAAPVAANGKENEAGGGQQDSDSDSDFEASDASDGGSPSSSGSGSDAGGSDAGTGSEDDEGEGESGNESGDEGEDDDVMEIDDPEHHPLLRAGALPKMSRAAMDAAVELVVGDLVGQGKAKARRDASSSAGSSGLGRAVGDDGREGGVGNDDEEDELED